MADRKLYAHVDYEDGYVQPLLLEALKSRLPPEALVLVNDKVEYSDSLAKVLQWRQYEKIDFDALMQHSSNYLANSYIIRKALIRKHYLLTTASHWLVKHPNSALGRHVKPSIEFEVDYAEFLDDALVEAFELKESWERNEGKEANDREWWILKPGMSDRGQGIRLFSSEDELTEIFQEWDPPSDDEDACSDKEQDSNLPAKEPLDGNANGILTSQLRHFVAQPYIHLPLLLPKPHPSADRKFHIRTYVLAVNALRVYVYRPMLALFAAEEYKTPFESDPPNENLSTHLTNTCLQSGEHEGSVHAFWSLPEKLPSLPSSDWRQDVFTQICEVTGEIFEAAARSMSIHFQPLPNAFEIFGLDFMVDAEGTAWLLEVNAFPDFAQSGGELQDLVRGLFEEVVEVAVKPFFGMSSEDAERQGDIEMVKVLDIDLGRR